MPTSWSRRDDFEYRLERTSEYVEDLREIEAETGHLIDELNNGLYLRIRKDPYSGVFSQTQGLCMLRQSLVMGLLRIQIWYQIDDERKVVHLIAIRPLDETRM
jgi:hypothetical protein